MKWTTGAVCNMKRLCVRSSLMVNQSGVVIDIVYLVFATEPSKGGLCTNPGVGSCSIPSPGVYALHDTYTRGEHEFCADDHETLAQTVGIAWDAWALTAVTQLNPQQQRGRFEALECAVQSVTAHPEILSFERV